MGKFRAPRGATFCAIGIGMIGLHAPYGAVFFAFNCCGHDWNDGGFFGQ